MSEGKTQPVVLVEQRDRILITTINRPEAKNAVDAAVSRGLADAMIGSTAIPDCRWRS